MQEQEYPFLNNEHLNRLVPLPKRAREVSLPSLEGYRLSPMQDISSFHIWRGPRNWWFFSLDSNHGSIRDWRVVSWAEDRVPQMISSIYDREKTHLTEVDGIEIFLRFIQKTADPTPKEILDSINYILGLIPIGE